MIPGSGLGIMRCCTAQFTPLAISPPTAAIATTPIRRSVSSPSLLVLLRDEDSLLSSAERESLEVALAGEIVERTIPVAATRLRSVLRMNDILA